MKLFRYEDMIKGWFVGAFEPTAYHTDNFEVALKILHAGERDHHYHTTVTEINLIVAGSMVLHGKTLGVGDIFVLEPYEITDCEYPEECHVVCVKTPSCNDKVSVITQS